MSVKARVGRLEKAAGVGRLCIECTRRLIRYSDLIRRTPREGVLVLKCDACGFPRHVILYGHTEREKELIRELHTPRGRTLEARRRRFTVEVYLMMTPRQREIEAAGDAEEKRLRGITPPSDSVRSQLKVLDEYAAQVAEKQAARRLLLSEDEEEARTPRRAVFREVMAVVDEARAQAQAANDEELYRLLMMTKLEAFIFGATLPETLEKIEAHERGVREAKETREREERERKERQERERREREERYRLEAEERSRPRRESAREEVPAVIRPRAASASDDTPEDWLRRLTTRDVTAPSSAVFPEPARMATVPDPADPSKRMILGGSIGPETYDASHPDAVQFMRSPRPDPTAGLTIADLEAEHERARGTSRRYYRGENYDGDPRY